MSEEEVIDDIRWVDENYIDLQKKYPNKYIVVKNREVKVAADTFNTAYERAIQILGAETNFTVERIEIGDLFAYNFEFQNKRTIR